MSPKTNGFVTLWPAVPTHRRIWTHLELTPGVRVFECPCGKADISFPLARLGALVEGMDFNSHFVAAARNKFMRAGLPGEFRSDDMRKAEFPNDLDLIINWASYFRLLFR